MRTIFHIKIEEDVYSVDINIYGRNGGGAESTLFKNGKSIKYSRVPALFEVPGGHIEVNTTSYGVKRIHHVTEHDEVQLTPDKKSPEGKRAKFKRNYPLMSRIIDILSIIVLIGGLIIGSPAMIEFTTRIPAIADVVGTFTSPFQFSDTTNIIILSLTVLAASERALSIKNHLLIDMETYSNL